MRKNAEGQGRPQQRKTRSKGAGDRRRHTTPADVSSPTETERGARPVKAAQGSAGAPAKMRIAKAIARAGLCSRRDAERWIADGRVAVNGTKISSPALDVSLTDKVLVDGTPLPDREPARLWRYHKPRGLVTTHRDPEGRPTVFANLPPELPRVISIGRLDFNTEGLLLLTTDGGLARHIELPSTGWMRRYRVRAHGRISQAELDRLQDGAEIDGIRYGPIEAQVDSMQGGNCWVSIGLREGKNREVRKIFGSLGMEVNRLIRVSFGPFQLLDLKPGQAEAVKQRVLVDQLGREVAEKLGLKVPQNGSEGRAVPERPPGARTRRASSKAVARSTVKTASQKGGRPGRDGSGRGGSGKSQRGEK